jgi:hypothetical protein
VAGLVAIPAASGTAMAATTTIDCDTASLQQTGTERSDWNACQKLNGTAACAFDNGDGTWTIALGYDNPTKYNLYASSPASGGGSNNVLTATNGSAADPDQISTFWTGTSSTAFTVTWSPASSSDPVTWDLMGSTYSFTETTQPLCASKPVPIMGNSTAAGIGLALLLGGFVLINRRQLGRLRRAPWLHKA